MAVGGSTPPSPGRPRPRGPGAALGAAVALLLVFAAVRLTTTPPPSPGADRAPSPAGPTALVDLPPRGSLAGDAEWQAGVTDLPSLAELPAERVVPFADDVPGQRIALVLGRDGLRTSAAWLTGPPGARPQQMVLATAPYPVGPAGPLALWDLPPGSSGLLVVVGRPGDAVDLVLGLSVDAGGEEHFIRYPLSLVDGAAAGFVALPAGTPSASLVVTRSRAGELVVGPVLSDRARRSAAAPIDPDDPRGLRSAVDEPQLQALLRESVGTYGLPPRHLSPVLLAAGPVGDSGDRAVLIGVTLPSGASVAWLSVAGHTDDGSLARTVSTAPAPAGAAPTDRVLAVPAGWAVSRIPLPPGDAPPGWLVVSGPRGGTSAVVLDAAGHPLATLPLVDGVGTGPVPQGTTGVRVLDAGGAPLGDTALASFGG